MLEDRNQRIMLIVLLASLSLPLVSMAGAIPPDPDNAALLYYQALLTMPKPEDEAADHLVKIGKGEIDPDQVRTFLHKCDNAIEFVAAAAQVDRCDWGYQFSRGVDVQLPQLAQLRRLAYVLAADARLAAFDGEYRQALERCRLMDSLSRHIGDDTLISYLVSLAVRQLAMQCIQDFTGRIADDTEGLRALKNELALAAPLTVSPVRPLKIEVEIMADLMQVDKRDKMLEAIGVSAGNVDPEDAEEIVNEADKTEAFVAALDAETLKRARMIYRERMAAILTMLNTPMAYAEKYSRLKKLCDDFEQDDPASRVAGEFTANMAKIYTLRIRSDAHANAVLAAVDLCLHRAGTGNLPETLPAGLPIDPFSGEAFEYERTDTGFVLRCQAKDPEDETIHEYVFTLK